MRRRIEICEKCRYFSDRKNLFVYCTLKSSELPKTRTAFEWLDVHDKCAMLAEYCIEEWNGEKKD